MSITKFLRGNPMTDEEILQSEEITETPAPPVVESYPAPLCWIERIGAWMLTPSNADPICTAIIIAAITTILAYAVRYGAGIAR